MLDFSSRNQSIPVAERLATVLAKVCRRLDSPCWPVWPSVSRIFSVTGPSLHSFLSPILCDKTPKQMRETLVDVMLDAERETNDSTQSGLNSRTLTRQTAGDVVPLQGLAPIPSLDS